jgi:hypothetical protein
MRASSGSAPGLPCGSPRGGRGDATPGPTRPSRSNARSRPSRRSVRPARAWSVGLTTSSGRPSASPDHSPKDGVYQRKYRLVSRCHVSLLRVVWSVETAHRRPRCGLVHGHRRVWLGGDGCAEGAPACRLAYRSGDGSLSEEPWCGWCSGRVGTRGLPSTDRGMRRTDTTPRSIPSTGTSSGSCWRGRSAAPHGCSARNLPVVVVLIDGHRPPLIDCVDDISFGYEGKLK